MNLGMNNVSKTSPEQQTTTAGVIIIRPYYIFIVFFISYSIKVQTDKNTTIGTKLGGKRAYPIISIPHKMASN